MEKMYSGIVPIDRNRPAGFAEFLMPKRDGQPELILGYLAAGRAVGILQARVTEGMLMLDRIYVSRQFRRTGIGSLLMEDLKKRVNSAGIRQVVLALNYFRMDPAEALATEIYLARMGFEEIGRMPVMMCTLSDIVDGPLKPLAHKGSEHCIRLKEVDDNLLRKSQKALSHDWTLPPVKKSGHLRESVVYADASGVKGCVILDPFMENADATVISDVRSESPAVLYSMIHSVVADFARHHSAETTLYTSPVNNKMKDFIMKITGEKAQMLIETRNFVYLPL